MNSDQEQETEPDQSQSLVGSARKQKYKELLDIGGICNEKSESTDAISTLKSIMKIVNISNRINSEFEVRKQIDNTTEVVLDAQVMKMSHELMRSAINKMGQIEFSDDEYFNVLNNCIEYGADWSHLTKIAVSVAKTAKYSQSLLGAYVHDQQIQEKVRKPRKVQTKSQLAQEKKPETVSRLQKEQKSAQKLNLVLNQINQLFQRYKTAIPYYELIVDPANFMNTVDNAFQVSFLFRDGTVFFEQDDFGLPAVRPVDKNETDRQSTDTYQCISSLTPLLCEEMIEKYGITEPLLRINREDHSSQAQ